MTKVIIVADPSTNLAVSPSIPSVFDKNLFFEANNLHNLVEKPTVVASSMEQVSLFSYQRGLQTERIV